MKVGFRIFDLCPLFFYIGKLLDATHCMGGKWLQGLTLSVPFSLIPYSWIKPIPKTSVEYTVMITVAVIFKLLHKN